MKNWIVTFGLIITGSALFAACGGGNPFQTGNGASGSFSLMTDGSEPVITSNGFTPDEGGNVDVDVSGGGSDTPGDPSDNSPPDPTSGGPGDKGSDCENDKDCDGILDPQDAVPDACTNLRVISYGTSSARVLLNDEEIFGPSSFHNKDHVVLDKHVNLKAGSNSLELSIKGSKGDQLIAQLWNCSEDPAVKLLEVTVTRKTDDEESGSI